MFSHQGGRACPGNYQGGGPAMGMYEQCMKECCSSGHHLQWPPGNLNYQSPSVAGRLAELSQFGGGFGQAAFGMHSMGPQHQSHYANIRAPSNNQYQGPPPFGQPGGDPCFPGDFWGGMNPMQPPRGGKPGYPGMQWDNPFETAHPSSDPWAGMMQGSTPFSSGGGFSNQRRPNQSMLGNNSRSPALNCPNPQVHQGYTDECNLKHKNEPSLFSRIMKRLRPPPPKCPLKPRVANLVSSFGGIAKSSSCFRPVGASKSSDAFESLDDLWNPRKIRRWGCVNNWDQHKESQWKMVIENKMGTCGPAGRLVENKVHEALDALHQEGADCIAYRMFYGILRRNEDVYLNPYLSMMSDEEFLRLIVALNNFYFEDKDKAKLFLDHPPPTWIEKIMQKETLAILDPNSRAPSIARRFWEVLLDWYVQKLIAIGDPAASCTASRQTSQSSIQSSLC